MLADRSRIIAVIGMIVSVGAAIGILWRAGLPAPSDSIENNVVPSFHLETLQGESVSVTPEMGHPLIINFWATWCVPCVREMPVLDRLYDEGVPVIGINAGFEDPSAVQTWINGMGISFPIVMDTSDRDLERLFHIRGLPTTFFVDANGIVQYAKVGELHEEHFSAGLRAIGIE